MALFIGAKAQMGYIHASWKSWVIYYLDIILIFQRLNEDWHGTNWLAQGKCGLYIYKKGLELSQAIIDISA